MNRVMFSLGAPSHFWMIGVMRSLAYRPLSARSTKRRQVSSLRGRASATDFGLSRRYLLRSADASLKRLGTDHIDLFYIHRVDPDTAWERVVATFGDLIRAGKVREWGLSNVRAWHIPHVVHLCRQMGVPEPAALQPYYNLMNRQPEVELLPAAKFFGVGVVPYSPLSRVLLSGKYRFNHFPDPCIRAARQYKLMM